MKLLKVGRKNGKPVIQAEKKDGTKKIFNITQTVFDYLQKAKLEGKIVKPKFHEETRGLIIRLSGTSSGGGNYQGKSKGGFQRKFTGEYKSLETRVWDGACVAVSKCSDLTTANVVETVKKVYETGLALVAKKKDKAKDTLALDEDTGNLDADNDLDLDNEDLGGEDDLNIDEE